jgi:cysteine desulfurase/selenocysteine lyase
MTERPKASDFDVDQFRKDFPILGRTVSSGAPLVYLDNAASTQRPRQVLDAMDRFYRGHYANVHRGIHTLSEEATAAYEQSRHTLAALIGCREPREIIIGAGATAAINLVARTWAESELRAGDHVLLTLMEHHANIVPWQQLAERKGLRIAWVPLTADGQLDLVAASELMDRLQPKLLAVTACSNVLGTLNPIEQLSELCRVSGAKLLVDAAQLVPHQPIDVSRWQADFVVFSGHKMCGPTGIGVLWCPLELLERLPPFLGGGGMIQSVSTDGFKPAAPPEKFEAGTPPIAEAIGLAAAAEYLQAIGIDRIHDHEQRLVRRAMLGLSEIPGVTLYGPAADRRGGIVAFTIDQVHAHDIAHALDTRGIAVRAGHHCTMPLHNALQVAATARASFYLYNTEAEVDALLDGVRWIRDQFANRGKRKRQPRSV